MAALLLFNPWVQVYLLYATTLLIVGLLAHRDKGGRKDRPIASPGETRPAFRRDDPLSRTSERIRPGGRGGRHSPLRQVELDCSRDYSRMFSQALKRIEETI